MRARLSVAIITWNEERNLDRCLRSVAFADEVVVVDAGSADRTREIAARRGATLWVEPFRGFVEQKNLAIERTRNEWVLSLDADEWLPEETAREIEKVLEAPAASAYALNRLSALSGGFLRHAWSPDWQTRLFRKGAARFAGGSVHESLEVRRGERTARLRHRLLHASYPSVAAYVERMNRYTDLAAADLAARGRVFAPARLLVSPVLTFVKLYVLRLGFLDGVRGFVVAAGSAYYVAVKYAKLWEIGRAPDPDFTAASEPSVTPGTGGAPSAAIERREAPPPTTPSAPEATPPPRS